MAGVTTSQWSFSVNLGDVTLVREKKSPPLSGNRDTGVQSEGQAELPMPRRSGNDLNFQGFLLFLLSPK